MLGSLFPFLKDRKEDAPEDFYDDSHYKKIILALLDAMNTIDFSKIEKYCASSFHEGMKTKIKELEDFYNDDDIKIEVELTDNHLYKYQKKGDYLKVIVRGLYLVSFLHKEGSQKPIPNGIVLETKAEYPSQEYRLYFDQAGQLVGFTDDIWGNDYGIVK